MKLTTIQINASERRRSFHAAIEAQARRLAASKIHLPRFEPSIVYPVIPTEKTSSPIPLKYRPIAKIQKVVADEFRIDPREMVSDRRQKYITWPRQIAMYLARQVTPHSFPEIGRRFGGRDHSTVMHAINRVEERMKTDRDLVTVITRLKQATQ